MRKAAGLFRNSLKIAVFISMSAGVAISFWFLNQASRAEEGKNAEIIHKIIYGVILPPLLVSDYGEVKRILERVSQKAAIVGVIIPPSDIIVSDDEQLPFIQNALKAINKDKCLDPHSPAFQLMSDYGTLTCTKLDLLSGNPRPDRESPNKQAYLVSASQVHFSPQTTRLLFMLLIVLTLVMMIMSIVLDRLIARNIIRPMSDVASALKGENINSARDRLNHLKNETFPLEVQGVVDSYRSLLDRLESEMKEREQLSGEAAKSRLARQTAHDIRSPLAALEMASQMLVNIPEEARVIIRHASARIRSIANTLVYSDTTKIRGIRQDALSTEMVALLIEEIVTEKQLQFNTRNDVVISFLVDEATYGAFVLVNKREFSRMISNLLNNSIEAITSKGSVEVRVIKSDERVKIQVVDNGSGISPDVLSKLGQLGATFGKVGGDFGSGLGLYHAHKSVENWGGSLKINSVEHSGTTVEIELPRAPSPQWFVPEIQITPDMRIVSLDDDPNIHSIWRSRFGAVDSFTDISTFTEWMGKNSDRKLIRCLMDYELIGEKQSGLDIIESLGISNISYLVTSGHDDEDIRSRCATLGIGIIPKSLASLIPIKKVL